MIKLDGQRFGKLVVEQSFSKNHRGYSICRCDCGNRFVTRNDGLKSGETVSCGCYNRDRARRGDNRRTHGQAGKPLYKSWQNMKNRCYNKKVRQYKDYGGRGITVCDEWRDSFAAFESWAMSSGYKNGLTVDRIDNDGNYCPENCRWITKQEQQSNKRNNHTAQIDGVSRTLTEWAKIYGVRPSVVNWRVNNGWDIKQALETPVKHAKR